MAATVWVTRHGERLDFVDPTWKLTAANPHNPPLTALGVQQARATGERLREAGITKIYTSPFLRCVQTAHAIAEELGGVPVHVEDGMAEFMNAAWFDERPPETDLDSLLELGQFPLLHRDYRSKVTATFPESISEAVYVPGCPDCGICHDWREFTECDGTNHVNEREPAAVRKAVVAVAHEEANRDQHILLVGHGCSVEAAYLGLVPSAPHKFPTYCSVTKVVRTSVLEDGATEHTWAVEELCTPNPHYHGVSRQ